MYDIASIVTPYRGGRRYRIPGRSCNPDHAPGQAAPSPTRGVVPPAFPAVGVLMTHGGCIALAVEDSRISPGPGGF